jgi:hypoxanthine phosphoribosyltransferase
MKKRITAHDLTFETLIERLELKEKVTAIGRQISEDYYGKRPLFLSVLNGSFIFAADLVRACDLECEIAFLRFSSYDGTQPTGQISTVFGLDIPIKDRHVIVIEDIVDSGHTLHHFITELHELEPASVALAATLIGSPKIVSK